jgi:hypothetical protein
MHWDKLKCSKVAGAGFFLGIPHNNATKRIRRQQKQAPRQHSGNEPEATR